MKNLIQKVSLACFLVLFGVSCSTPQTIARHSSDITGYENPLTVRIKIVILQRDDGTGNFDMNNPTEAKDLKDYVQSALDGYNNFVQPDDLTGCYDGLDFMKSALINFDVQYAEVQNSYAWNYRNTGSDLYTNKIKNFSPRENWYLKAVDDSISQAEKEPTIHVYLTNDGERFDHVIATKGKDFVNNGKAAGQFPTQQNLDRSSQIHRPNVYLAYYSMKYQAPKDYNKSWANEIRSWFVNGGGKGLTHELGHNFGLGHSNPHHRANKCKYSIMSQKHKDPRNYLQPTEIKKIHDNFTRTNLMQFVTADSHYGFTQAISANTKWDKKRRFFNDFIIQPGVTLEIDNEIILPLNAKVTITKNAKVQLTNKGKVSYPDGKKFDGWVIEGELIGAQ